MRVLVRAGCVATGTDAVRVGGGGGPRRKSDCEPQSAVGSVRPLGREGLEGPLAAPAGPAFLSVNVDDEPDFSSGG